MADSDPAAAPADDRAAARLQKLQGHMSSGASGAEPPPEAGSADAAGLLSSVYHGTIGGAHGPSDRHAGELVGRVLKAHGVEFVFCL